MSGERGEKGDHGQPGAVRTGERGESGDRGVAGERGPKGDHGQTGDTGDTGAVGPQGKAGNVLTLLIAVAAVALAVLSFFQVNRLDGFTQTLHDSQVNQCERNNTLRTALFNNTKFDAQTRERVADSFPPVERKIVLSFARQNRADLEALVDASADVAMVPGGVVQDCEAAFPPP